MFINYKLIELFFNKLNKKIFIRFKISDIKDIYKSNNSLIVINIIILNIYSRIILFKIL